MEAWIVDQRRAICTACPQRPTCAVVKRVQLWWEEIPACPLHKLPARLDAIAARAWPADAPPASGCCDRADQA